MEVDAPVYLTLKSGTGEIFGARGGRAQGPTQHFCVLLLRSVRPCPPAEHARRAWCRWLT